MSWAEPALHAILDRAAATEPRLGGRWPLFADPASGAWTTTARGSWTGGFWAGLLWLRAIVSGERADRDAAAARTAALAPWTEADTAARGLILWYGTALADHDEQAGALRERAARACLDAFHHGLGVVPWGTAFGGVREVARVDALPGLVRLLGSAGPAGREAAREQLDLQASLTLRDREPRPAWRPLRDGEPLPDGRAPRDGSWVPHPEPPAGWSRTVAWLALAVADGVRAGVAAESLSRALLTHEAVAARFAPGAPPVPPASSRRPGGPPDTSAAAIEAVAALKLSALPHGALPGPGAAGALRDRAAAVLAALVAGHVREGRLLDGCYDLDHDVATGHELIWGDFFLATGLAILIGVLDPFTC